MAILNRDGDKSADVRGTTGDLASRELSVASYENAFMEGVYDKIAKVYDWTFGPTLHPGRIQALQRMGIRADESILEVGVGTGINLSMYPKDCKVTGIDYSENMLEKARERVARKGIRNARLLQMDGGDLKFADNTFDIVYAPYVISVVPDPVKVAREMYRVCRPGGRVIILNHFLSPNSLMARVERMISPAMVHLGFKSDLDLPAFLAQAELEPVSIEKVNFPKWWSLVTVIKDGPQASSNP
jgi:phosphatidylethanolamine/phosphatidyl-N-methylethanolamine N-methyltransferase